MIGISINKIFAKSIAFLLFLVALNLRAQDYSWWNTKHEWDGKTSWSRYITLSPKFLGPNALPVPEIKTGSMNSEAVFTNGYEYHYSKGEQTHNAISELFIPFQSNKVGLNFSWVPVEFFRMDSTVRDLRKSRDLDGKGNAVGDVYIGTFIQLLSGKNKLPDVLLTINLKTASGSNLEAARYTDTPGYFFDISAGKKLARKGALLKMFEPYAMLGFYVWQTRRDDYHQNDAFLYGLGMNLHFAKLEIRNAWGGYVGYINNGDRPMIYRLALRSKRDKMFNYELRFQQGFQDFAYSSLRASCLLNLGKLKNRS